MPKARPILDQMLADMANKSKNEVVENMADKVEAKTQRGMYNTPTNASQLDGIENPYICDYPFEPNPVKIGNNFACKLPTSSSTEKELSYFETPWMHPYLSDLTPPQMYNNVEKNILSNLIGKEAMDQITYINTLGDTNLLPNRCPPYGYPNLTERAEVPVGSKRYVCREPMPNTQRHSFDSSTGISEPTNDNAKPKWKQNEDNKWYQIWDENGVDGASICNTLNIEGKPNTNKPDYSKEYYVTWDNVATCRPRVTNGSFHCPQKNQPEYVKHITLPNGYGMCVLDESYDFNKAIVPFSLMAVIPQGSEFDKKLQLIHNTIVGLKMKKKDIEVFKIVLDNARNMVEVKALELALDKALNSDIDMVMLGQYMTNLITTKENGKPMQVSEESSEQMLANFFHSVGSFNLMHQILLQADNYSDVASVNLLVKHIEVDADLTLAKMALNTYATTILRLPPIMTITSSDLAFFGIDRESQQKYEHELRDYFTDLHRLTYSTTDFVPDLAEQS
jgi:hypothetical protein